jgi:hypothetical protein
MYVPFLFRFSCTQNIRRAVKVAEMGKCNQLMPQEVFQ